MKFFDGFGFRGGELFFADFLPCEKALFCAAGFSMGAIEAFEYALGDRRIEKLVLLSPAFFMDKDEKFRKTQLRAFDLNAEKYMNNFYANCGDFSTDFIANFTDREIALSCLEFLLNYRWETTKFSALKNTEIEIYLGENDKIIDAQIALEFFSKTNAQILYIKGANHLLQRSNR